MSDVSISKRAYFLNALHDGSAYFKGWVIEAFAYVENTTAMKTGKEPYPWPLLRDKSGRAYTQRPGHAERIWIEDAPHDGALFHFDEALPLMTNDLPNVSHPLSTFYGNALINQCTLVYGYGDKIPFQIGKLTVRDVEKLQRNLQDTPEKESDRQPNKLYIDEYKRFSEGVSYLEGFASICVPTATPKTITVDKSVLALKAKLYNERTPEELQDPLVLAKLDKELTTADRASFKGDPAERFFIKSKAFDIVRKRMFLSQGQENGLGVKGKTILTSLDEGWDIENLPSVANAQRSGSYSRGFLTALGGVESKNNFRFFQNTVIRQGDCGTTLGLRLTLTKASAPFFVSSYVIEKNGKLTELTEENLASYIGKPIVVRSLGYCKEPRQNVCAVCAGTKLSTMPTAIPTLMASVGSVFQGVLMSAMHGTALKSVPIDYLDELS
jgi:hypothetical protein